MTIATQERPSTMPRRVATHLRAWAGHTDHDQPVMVVPHPGNDRPGWSGAATAVTGVIDPAGRLTLAVPTRHAPAAAELLHRTDDLTGVADILGRPGERVERLTFRWTVTPADLPPVGTWVHQDDPALPDWLRPFGGPALCARDDRGTVLAGVGIKRHDRWVHELAIVTAPAARGRGLARRLVAQAARHLLRRGIVPTYLHRPDNVASARVAEAAGFPTTGWQALLLSGDC